MLSNQAGIHLQWGHQGEMFEQLMYASNLLQGHLQTVPSMSDGLCIRQEPLNVPVTIASGVRSSWLRSVMKAFCWSSASSLE